MVFRSLAAALLALLCIAPGASAWAQQASQVRVNVFPGATNLPFFWALERGLFERHGVKVELQFTRSSQEQRDGLALGKFEIAYAAVDNAVAMLELAGKDVIIVTGGDCGLNEIYVRGEIKSLADVRGHRLVVDAPNTAYALQAKKILQLAGLSAGKDYEVVSVGGTPLRLAAMLENPENAAGILNPPFSFEGIDKGLHSLGRTTEVIGPYQAGGAFTLRSWAEAHALSLEGFIAGFIEGTRLAQNPANRTESIRMLAERLHVSNALAARTYDALMIPGFGLAADAAFNKPGFDNVLALRAEIEHEWGGTPPPASRYIDLTYYERALRNVK